LAAKVVACSAVHYNPPVMRPLRLPLLGVLLLALCSCTNVNVPLNGPDVPLETRVRNHTRAETGGEVALPTTRPGAPDISADPFSPRFIADADGYFVGLALSGGGSRSSNFSAACMFELQRIGLLRHVDYISSVSGGSLTAAFYCVSDEGAWNPGEAQRKLTHPFASDVIIKFLMPWNMVALLLSDRDRSDLLAESFKDNVLKRDGRALSYADLRADRPRLLINATDLQSGRAFIFCDESFDQLNSDLSKFPLASAVAASAAVPVVMHQVTLRDYSTTFNQFRHLVDGGVSDNLGITSLVETYIAQLDTAARAGRSDPYPNGAIFIVIDARTQFDAHLNDKGDVGVLESLAAGASLTSSQLLNRVSTATLADIIVRHSPDEVTAAELRRQIAQLDQEGYLELRDRRGHRVIVVHVALSQAAELKDTPSPSFFNRLNNIATYFNISDEEAASLYQAAELLMRQQFEPRMMNLSRELEHGGEH
jgi:predicted acylesterase/phospholipase RssA